ncbi:MAG: MFS transporter [Alphaproteobacteria bacterium]|nr:MAG: MFS transporter [Alphaproteobacteria bacterium]TMJ98110.1 MAG: MFS transporter [Alphaproteobacteria bacterium]
MLSSVLHPSFALRLAIFYAALFAALGVQVPFLPLWLAAKGLDASTIGMVLSVPMLMRLLAIPLATRIADRHDALRAIIAIASALAMLGYGAMGLAQGALAVITAFALASIFYTPLMPLADAYALRGLGALGRAYGPVRLWGSAAFIVGSFAGGLVLDVVPARDLIWLVAAALVMTASAACTLSPLAPRETSTAKPLRSARDLLRDPALLAAMAAASLIQASHAIYYGFSTLDWAAAGLDGSAIGALWALGVVAEIVLFAMSGRLPVAPTTLILFGAAGAAVRWGAMAFDPPAVLLAPLQCLHGLSFGATHLGALGFIARTAPAEASATAQGYLAVALGLAMAAAMGVSGVLYARWGSFAYVTMALLAAAGGVFALAARRLTGGT